jgi:hypothetical protein
VDLATIFRPADFDALLQSGYVPRWVSIFDHWLTEAEAADCALMSFSQAVRHAQEPAYRAQEARFMAFYAALFGANPATLPDGSAVAATDFSAVLIRSLREEALMDIYLPARRLRIMGGYDRTDLLLFESEEGIEAVAALATQHGLFVLSAAGP